MTVRIVVAIGAGLCCLVAACEPDARVCTAALIEDSIYVDVRAVALPLQSVRLCLPDACHGPVEPVDGRAWPLPGGVGHLDGTPTTIELTLLDAAGRPLASSSGPVEPTAVGPNLDGQGNACGPTGWAARVRVSEDGRSFSQVRLDAA